MKRLEILKALLLAVASSSAAAQCQNNWTRASAQTLAISSFAKFTLNSYESGESILSISQDGEASLDIIFIRGATLVKGFPGADLEVFVRDQSRWMQMVFATATIAITQASKAGPCEVDGTQPVATNFDGALRLHTFKLISAVGKITALRPGEIAYQLTMSTEPTLPEGQALTYTGTMSFQKPESDLPDVTEVGNYSVVRRGQATFVASTPTSLAQLRTLISLSPFK